MDTNFVVRRPTFIESIIPLIFIVLLLSVGYGSLSIPIEIIFIIASFITALIALRIGLKYSDIEAGIVGSITKGMPSILILIVIGAVIGSWMASGTIPMMIYYGLDLISPRYFLATACIVCTIISLFTGTSWGTLGTLGVAFMGIADSLGIPLDQTAGAIISGAYFGDKMSPLSDTTNLAPMIVGTDLFSHIRHMLWTTAPAWILGLIIYVFVGFFANEVQSDSIGRAEVIQTTLLQNYTFNWMLLLPIIVMIYVSYSKKPVVPGLIISCIVAVILSIIFQNMDVKTATTVMVSGFVSESGSTDVDKLLTRGGMISMMQTILLALCAFAFSGILQKAKMLEVLLSGILVFANTVTKLIISAIFTTLGVSFLIGSAYLSILIPGELFAPAFRKFKLAPKNLSRILEDSGTVFVPLVPWSVQAIFIAGLLGVSPIEYAPWAIMCYSCFLFSILYALTGFSIEKE